MRRAHSILASVAAGFLCAATVAAQAEGVRAPDETAAPLPHPGHARAPAPAAAQKPESGAAAAPAAPASEAKTVTAEPAADPLPRLVEKALADDSVRSAPLKGDAATASKFYASRGYEPMWLNEYGFTGQARAIATRLARAGDDGLDPAAYEIRPPLSSSSPAARARSEVELTLKILRFAREARQGRLQPSALGDLVSATPDAFDEAAFLKSFAGASDPAALLDAQNPQHPQFQALREELKRLREYTGTVQRITAIPSGPTLKLGMRDDAVPFLRERLKVPARPEADASVYEPELAVAVRKFQEQQGLTVDGVVGAHTREMLNAPVSVTAADIVANMERWRWLPRKLGAHHVFVNIPEFKARVVENDRVTFETRVIVGKESNRTPVFSDEIEYVDVNPYWNVPYSIATKEMLPEIRRDPEFFYKRGIQVLYTGDGKAQLIDPMSVDWSRITAKNMPFRFRQPPGEANALGRVKFMFPNKHSVYLHDTPTRNLFSRSQRALSHGCVRVDDPIAFGHALLSEEKSLDGEKIRKLIGGGSNGAYPLKTRVPVHLTYFTVWAGEDGSMKRWSDVYGYDEQMKRLLGVAG